MSEIITIRLQFNLENETTEDFLTMSPKNTSWALLLLCFDPEL